MKPEAPLVVSFSNIRPKKIDAAVSWQLAFTRVYAKHGCVHKWMVHTSEFDETFESFRGKGLDVEIVPLGKTRGFSLVIYLLGFIIRHRVEIIHLHFVKPFDIMALVVLARIFLQRTVFIYHKHSPGRIIRKKLSIKRYVNPLSLMSLFVSRIICVSNSIRENCLNRGVSGEKAVTVYNGIDIERYGAGTDTGRIRSEFHIPADHRIVTVIKDARPETGIDALLCSVPGVITVHPGTTFLIVGGGAETGRLKDLSLRLGIEKSVVFAGVRNDIPDIIAESYITVDPSPVEAFGLVITESMAGGRPVVAVNTWGPREIIEDGVTGLLVDPGDPTDFASAINRLLASPETVAAMGAECRRQVKRFSVERMVDETVRISLALTGRVNKGRPPLRKPL